MESHGVLTKRVIAGQRRLWSKRAGTWDDHGSVVLEPVIDAVMARVPDPAGTVVDVGCGTGALSLRVAGSASQVLAVDVSSTMVGKVRQAAQEQGLKNVTALAMPAELLDLEPGSVDTVVSNYALHHLRDADKDALVQAARRWLRPGGRLVIGDMMFGRGGSARDREIITSKVTTLLKKGPGGVWRIAKNVPRFMLRVRERPLPLQSWVALLERAGFAEVKGETVVAEAAVVVGVVPGGDGAQGARQSPEATAASTG